MNEVAKSDISILLEPDISILLLQGGHSCPRGSGAGAVVIAAVESQNWVKRLHQKIDLIKERAKHIATNPAHPFEFFDFGLRRRFSAEMQDLVVSTLARELPSHFKGTSNVHLARDRVRVTLTKLRRQLGRPLTSVIDGMTQASPSHASSAQHHGHARVT